MSRPLRIWTAAWAAAITLAQPPNPRGPAPYQLQPDLTNVSYGPHERNVMDIWKAKSDRPTPVVVHIHGGGFVAGDKTMLSPFLLKECLRNGISVVTINYHYGTQAPYPAAMQNGARAILLHQIARRIPGNGKFRKGIRSAPRAEARRAPPTIKCFLERSECEVAAAGARNCRDADCGYVGRRLR